MSKCIKSYREICEEIVAQHGVLNKRDSMVREQDYKCYYCEQEMIYIRSTHKISDQPHAATIEHLIRVCDGGSNDKNNLVAACHMCNSSRHDIPPELWKRVCKTIILHRRIIKTLRKRIKEKRVLRYLSKYGIKSKTSIVFKLSMWGCKKALYLTKKYTNYRISQCMIKNEKKLYNNENFRYNNGFTYLIKG